MTPPSSSKMARPGGKAVQWPSPQRTFCTVSCGRDAKRTGRWPAWSARSALRPARLPDRTAANVAAARTNVPTAVPHEAQSMVPVTGAFDARRGSGSPFDHSHLLLVVVLAGGRGKLVQSVDLLGTEGDTVRTDVLFDPRHALRARNRNDVVTFCEKPGQRDLTRRGTDLGRDGLHFVDEPLVA